MTRKVMQTMKSVRWNRSKQYTLFVRSKSFSKHKPKPASAMNQYSKRIDTANCGRCGRQHSPERSPAWGKTFLKCSRKHNFAEMCRIKFVKELVQGGTMRYKGYKGVQGGTRGYKEVQGGTKGTRRYKGVQGGTRGYKEVQEGTRRYKGVQGGTRG